MGTLVQLHTMTREIVKPKVNTQKLGDHHILTRCEKDREGKVVEEHIVMWGGHNK